jgi:plastocyanin
LTRFLLPLAALATILVAGCGGTDASEPVATNEVSMAKSYRVDPSVVEIRAGDTVQIDDQPDHKVGRGDSVSITFDKPGRYDYVCTLHSHDMHGQVIVT